MNCPNCQDQVDQLFSTVWGVFCRRCREAARAHQRDPDGFMESRIRGMQLLAPQETKEQLRARISRATFECCQAAGDSAQATAATVKHALERFEAIYPRTLVPQIQN